MEVTLSTVFDHPIADAGDGLAVRRAENHPRWHPHIGPECGWLAQSRLGGPRRNTRFG
jgi:hypothetical protein